MTPFSPPIPAAGRWVRALDAVRAARSAPWRGGSSVLVVAPHPDDEVLGCGGTILQLRGHGHRVHGCILTDGASAHRREGADPTAMVAAREQEAETAGERLGLCSLELARLPDGRLDQVLPAATEVVIAQLEQHRPTDVFVTWAGEPHEDHGAAARAVHRAVLALGRPTTVHEFPVWAWHQPPWCAPHVVGRRATIRAALREVWGLHSVVRFGEVVDVVAELPGKCHALQAYSSQMGPFDDDRPTLSTVADGRWIGRFFTGTEVFRSRLVAA